MRSATRRQPAARGPRPDAGAVVARLMRVIDPAFLAEAGWDPGSGVLSLPSGHPLRLAGVPGARMRERAAWP